MKTRHIAIVSTQSETWINFDTNSVLFCQKEVVLGRFEDGCFPVYIQLAPRLTGRSFNMDADSFASHTRGGEEEGTCPDFRQVCAPVEAKSVP